MRPVWVPALLLPVATEPGKSLSTRLFAAARVLWLVLAAGTIAMLVAGVPALYQQMVTVCETGCNDWQLSAEAVRRFAEAGIDLGSYAVYFITCDLLFSLAYLAVAGLLIWRAAAEDAVGLFASFVLLAFGGVALSATAWAFGEANPRLPPLVSGVSALSNVVVLIFFYVFPDGRFVPGSLRWIAILAFVTALLQQTQPGTLFDPATWPRPLAIVYTGCWFGTALFGQAYRYARVSDPVQRQQTKWVVLGLAAAFCGFFGLRLLYIIRAPLHEVIPVLDPDAPAYQIVMQGALNVFLVLPAVGIAAAILRYRLFDVDLFINRTVIYGSMTAILLTAFVLASTVLQRSLEEVTGTRADVVTLGIAVLLALGFQPLRARVRAVADLLLPSRQELALLFTDIVGSTDRLATVGDSAWRVVLDRYRATVRRELKRYGGSEMHIAGDSFFATFTDPWRAVRCALELRPSLSALGVPSRFGLHWGACEMRGEEVSGLAVWTAARVMSTAAANEIVLSDAMRVALGSGDLLLEDRGVHSLKGIPEQLRLHAIARTSKAGATIE